MESIQLTNYLKEAVKKNIPQFQWKIEFNTADKVIDMHVVFSENVPPDLKVQDETNTTNESGRIQFEDQLCFYDPAVSHIAPENYLKTIRMNFETGIEKGFVDSAIKYLNIVLTEGLGQFNEFVYNPAVTSFEFKWNETDFKTTLETMKATNRYEKLHLHLSKKETDSFFDKLKEDE
ncbi:DUF3013 family protein [Lacticigenium naphthae]|uniref:DUF3013 family protein n=1 Tax=Lacticigenium naphthae TaxID=515351 RepID=UPI000418EBE0|nr:DUF3013 family protein [Lacticigenium naphthae]